MNASTPARLDSGFGPTVQLLASCPLLAASDTVVKALGLSLALAFIVPTTILSARMLRPWLHEDNRLPAAMMLLAGTTACVERSFQAWLPGLGESIGIFLPLIVANLIIVEHSLEHSAAAAADWRKSMVIAAGMAATLLILGVAREWVGRGSLLHDAGRLFGPWAGALETTIFRVDMGFLLAMLPPGAFISLGLLLALRNWLARRSMTPRTPHRP